MTAVEQDNTGTQTPAPVEEQVVLDDSIASPYPAKGTKNDADRDYVVLKRHNASSPNSPQMWEFVTNIRAANPEQAGRRAAEQPGTSFLNTDGPTFLVAVPVRNFSTFTLTVRTETTIVIS